MSAPEEFCLSRAIQMFALLLLLLLSDTINSKQRKIEIICNCLQFW